MLFLGSGSVAWKNGPAAALFLVQPTFWKFLKVNWLGEKSKEILGDHLARSERRRPLSTSSERLLTGSNKISPTPNRSVNIYGCGSKPMVPFRGRCTTHVTLVYFCGDWDVHWGYDLDFDPWPYLALEKTPKAPIHRPVPGTASHLPSDDDPSFLAPNTQSRNLLPCYK